VCIKERISMTTMTYSILKEEMKDKCGWSEQWSSRQ
jgi:hypothetical protein